MRYDPKKIESKWRKKWLSAKTYEPNLKNPKNPFYNLMMFPYPSAEGLHIGSMRTFTGVDMYGRFKRMQGYDVFEPMGLDGFGIHSENYALKAGKHPFEHAKDSEKNFYRQLSEMGNGFAWEEHLETYDPEYYKWTQWIFATMFKRGLAYRKKSAVNWCSSCMTVLADEQVISGQCERCSTIVVKKDLEQWFFKITDYAERMLKNLDTIDWSEPIKIAQKNWIGKSEGALIKFLLKVPGQPDKHVMEVFTTRPDTLFGATFAVVSPELAQKWLDVGWQAPEGVKKYVGDSLSKNEMDRLSEGREKTGVFSGVYAVNPADKKEIPVWVADYVLGNVGTGAIMAVPAHDQRDYDFAKKYGIPIRHVVVPRFIDELNPQHEGKRLVPRNLIIGIVRDPRSGKYLGLKWKKQPWTTFVTGGIDKGEDPIVAARREIQEETGYKNLKFVRVLGGPTQAEFFAAHKDENRTSRTTSVLFELENDEREKVSSEEFDRHEAIWFPESEITREKMAHAEIDLIRKRLHMDEGAYSEYGVLIDSGSFSGQKSEEAKWEITKFVGGIRKIQYRLRDWLLSRQRYWGPPIPMIFCESCAKAGRGERTDMPGWHAVPEKDLPVKLPYIKDFRPTGKNESPLASVESFYKVRCPDCRAVARRETDVSDTFLDSAWYYLRYLSVKDKKQAWNPDTTKKWTPVDMYIGGAEHAVLHLLYVRFVAMAFHDWGMLNFEEPFKKFRTHGLITKDGAKMSKSKGNVVNPDDYINAYGTDAVRMYLAFLAPLDHGGDFRDSGIKGLTRFLERVWKFGPETNLAKKEDLEMDHFVNKAVKKVEGDIENFQYNTAISSLMVLLNEFEAKREKVTQKNWEVFLKLLAPFAPHITEELFQQKRKKFTSIHRERWPEFDPNLIKEETFELVIQVNGKVRGKIFLPTGATEMEAKNAVFSLPNIRQLIAGAPKKVIYVSNRLINFVV